ncbi:MAG: FAD-binding oxidoreductase [Melioribacteraceae bacterium]|nr:FAD-binding oxidoreductase [Melioribacteraceae bacterium]
MLSGKYLELFKQLQAFLSEDNLVYDELRTLAYGTDGSFYKLIPKLVVTVENENETVGVIKKCNELNIPITFRSAGTSLSGQSVTDSVLLRVSRNWKGFEVLQNGELIKLAPGVIGGHANTYLIPYGKRIGPDPASINSAMISGIAANNASGMTSGTANNIYNSLESMRIVFNDGTILDTGDKSSRNEFLKKKPEVIEDIKKLREEIHNNEELLNRIKTKYKLKNTTGLGINSFVDFEDPFNILQHLMIGSEGILGFISQITLRTMPDNPYKATSLMLFKDIDAACKAIPIFETECVNAAEVMDRPALRSVEDKPGMPDYLKELDEKVAALLVETTSTSEDELKKNIESITKSIKHLPKAHPVSFTSDKVEFKRMWDVRKGIFPSACKSRKPGTTSIIEDVNFPTSKLAEAVLKLQDMFKKHGYNETVIWGHSLVGNIHFVFSQDFSSKSEIVRYDNFMKDIARLVVEEYNGSLKAEHGTGRNMAPFVEYEWGSDAYKVMKKVKSIFDEKNIFNPGVVLNADKNLHLKNLKPFPIADELIDKCIECGFCEVQCPSRNLTLTPRQRIVSYREISLLHKTGEDPNRLTSLKKSFKYYGEETCAVDGLCELTCPVDINTGSLIKKLRLETNSNTAKSIASFISNNMSAVETSARIGLNIVAFKGKILGNGIMEGSSKFLRKISGDRIPLWNKYLPKGADSRIPEINNLGSLDKVVYFPSCISRSMGLPNNSNETVSLNTKTHEVLAKAGYEIIYPKSMANLCCGMPFASKGFKDQADEKSIELLNELIAASNYGEYPILFDTSPCLYHIKEFLKKNSAKYDLKLELFEPIEFIYKFLRDKLDFKKLDKKITIHTTCSSTKMGLTDLFKDVAELCASEVIIPNHVSCCGFAGDRGFTHPELNESALKDLKPQLPEDCNHGYSSSKTCEIGLSNNSGIEYNSIFYLVDECTSRKQ